ncbi:hypothetical protein Tco_1321427 [Tanacetum coccineum]
MSANDDFSLHDDEELSLHDDASLNGSAPASNKGDAPAKPPQIIPHKYTFQNIKTACLQKDDYDTRGRWRWKHYLEFIDKKFLGKTVGKKNRLLYDKEDFWGQPFKTSDWWPCELEENANAILKQQFEAFLLLSKELGERVMIGFKTTITVGMPVVLIQIDGSGFWKEMDINWPDCYAAIKIRSSTEDRECKFKGTKDGSRQEASRGQDFKPVRTEKEALMTIDEGQSDWVLVERLLMRNSSCTNGFLCDNEVSMCSRWCLDSFNVFKLRFMALQSNAEVLSYEEEMDRGIFVLRETDPGYYDIPLYSRFKQVEYKGVPSLSSYKCLMLSSIGSPSVPSMTVMGEHGTVAGAIRLILNRSIHDSDDGSQEL